MEFQAAINALTYLPERAEAKIFTDSRVLINAVNKSKLPAAYEDQIKIIQLLSENKFIQWQWVKAHSGVTYNERCDELCIQARQI